MYNLQGNREWTDKIKRAFKKGITRAYLISEDVEINADNYLMSVDFSDEKADPEDGRFIGKSICREINIKLNNRANELNLENKEVEYYLGAEVDGEFVYINFGKFIVQKPENQEVNEETTFTAFDYMSRFDVRYTPSTTFPASLKDIIQDICNQCGVELGSTEFRNSDKIIEANPFLNAEQCREVVKSIAKVSFSCAYIGQDNKLYFGFEKNNEIVETINIDNYFEMGNNNDIKPITIITLRSGEVEASGQSIRNSELIEQYGLNELIIEEDYFAFTDELRQSFLEEASYLFGLTYTPIDIDLEGSAYLNFNDVIKIQNLNGEEKITYALNNYHTYNGVLYNSVSVPALTESEKKYTYKDEDSTKRTKTTIEIDKANARIDMVVKQISDTEQKLAETNINIDGIKDTVYTKDEVKEITEELKRDIEGVTNTLTENGGNNLIYYDSEFWTGKSEILPNEYKIIKYIESTGTQYIDTGYFVTENTRIKAKFLSRDTGNKNWFGGSVVGSGATADGFAFNSMSNNSVEFAFGKSGWNTVTAKNVVNYPFTIDFSRTGIIVNDELIATPNFDTFSEQTGSLRIFSRASGATSSIISGRCYNFSIYENGALVRDYIPCLRNEDEVPGLYDIINGEFYSNVGFGKFGYDYELPEEYQEIEYLETSGSQYINTGHAFTGKTTFDLDIMETQHGNSEWCMFIGVRDGGWTKQLLMSCNTTGLIGGDYGATGSAFQGSESNIKNNLAYIKTKIERSNYEVYINNTLYATTPYQEFTSGLNGYLFGFNVDGNAHMREAHFRIYACKIYEDGVIVRNFVPCYNKENNIAGFYDMVNDVFYPNSGTGAFINGNNVNSYNYSEYNTDKIEEYTNTEIQNNSISSMGYILNNGAFEQSVNNVVNGIYTVSFKYKKLKELATGSVYINDVKYDLTEMAWTDFVKTIEVNSNNIKIKLESDSKQSFYITDLLINLGNSAEIWTQNPNETRTDTVKIGKGIQITSSTKNTKLKADADGVRIVKASNENDVPTEFTDKGTKTEYIESKGGDIAGILIQKVTYNNSEQTWISSLL